MDWSGWDDKTIVTTTIQVDRGGPAAVEGTLRPGDRIIAINGKGLGGVKLPELQVLSMMVMRCHNFDHFLLPRLFSISKTTRQCSQWSTTSQSRWSSTYCHYKGRLRSLCSASLAWKAWLWNNLASYSGILCSPSIFLIELFLRKEALEN